MAALPQCVQSAKDLYDLRSRYKDAGVLISAIYSESMVIAASLSQIQNLLQHDAMQSKPQLLQTFDSALTGCRVVYGCLEDEVRDLVAKTEQNDLKFKDRAKFLWKEDTFKELLTQIRGQQSALSLLIQGLQMESIADIRTLVTANSATLDQVVERSKTLRKAHPRVQVPESVFSNDNTLIDATDVESILHSTEFTFDDEVVNSKAYRRAMALYTSKGKLEAPITSSDSAASDDPPAYEPSILSAAEPQLTKMNTMDDLLKEIEEDLSTCTTLEDDSGEDYATDDDANDDALLASIEREFLPFMPQNLPRQDVDKDFMPEALSLSHRQTSNPVSESTSTTAHDVPLLQSTSQIAAVPIEEAPPALPPRRPNAGGRVNSLPAGGSSSSSPSTINSDAHSTLSKVSTTSSHTMYDPSDPTIGISRKPMRKSLPLNRAVSSDAFGSSILATKVESPIATIPALSNADMHALWEALHVEEKNFVERMTMLRKNFFDNVIKQWPLLEKHMEAILVGEQLANLHKELLIPALEQMKEIDSSICDPCIFESWMERSQRSYREYCQRMPHALSSLRTTQKMDPKFQPFVNTLGLSLAWFGKGWEDYLQLPLVHMGGYISILERLIVIAKSINDNDGQREASRLQGALECIQWLRTVCSTLVSESQNHEDIQNLERRIHTLDAENLSSIHLLDPSRRLIHQGPMALKLKSHGAWTSVHVIVTDNYLFWGKIKPSKKGKEDKILVLDKPMMVGKLELVEKHSKQSGPAQKDFEKATLLDEIPRGTIVYPIPIKEIDGKEKQKPHLFGALGYEEHKVWTEALTSVIGK